MGRGNRKDAVDGLEGRTGGNWALGWRSTGQGSCLLALLEQFWTAAEAVGVAVEISGILQEPDRRQGDIRLARDDMKRA